MIHKILPFLFVASMLTGCATYKAGQTPDDVYYSPVKEVTATHKNETTTDKYERYLSSEDDQYLRMKVRNQQRWSTIDDYGYWYDSRFDHCLCRYPSNNYYGYNTYYNSPWRNNWNFGGYYYSPVYPIVYYKSPKVYTGTTGKSNLATYRNRTYDNQNYGGAKTNTRSNNFGNLMKQVFTNSNAGSTNSNTSWERPVRTYEAGTQTNSNAGGRSSGYDSKGSSSSAPRPVRN